MKTASRRRTAPALLAVLLALVCGTAVLAAPALAEEGSAAPAEEEPAYSADVPPELASAHALLIDRETCLLYTSPSPRDYAASRMPSSA